MSRQKVVFEHTQGPHAGLMTIIGAVDGEIGALLKKADGTWPDSLASGPEMIITVNDRQIEFASLVSVNARQVLYREAFPRQVDKLGEMRKNFDPAQV